jgi:ribosomal 50S subunit-associated protein YjgA (DUF615 family)
LATRTNLTPEDLVFCAHDDPKKTVNVKDMSRAFRLAARKLQQSGAINFEIRKGKPSELRLYNLRKYFRKQAHQTGFENVNYLMGHTVRGSDANYKPQDPEFYRKIYEEKAMPFLRLETATPTETEKTISELKKQVEQKDQKLQELEMKIQRFEPMLNLLSDSPTLDQLLKDIKEARFAKIETERSYVIQIPTTAIEELIRKNPKADRVEFTLSELEALARKHSQQTKNPNDTDQKHHNTQARAPT